MSALYALLALLSLLALTATAAPSASWKRVERVADLTTPLRLTIGIKQQNIDKLTTLASTIANPKTSTYRKHLSYDTLNTLVAPSTESIAAVRNWLLTESDNVPLTGFDWSVNGEWLSVDTTVAGAEKLLNAEYHTYQHVASGVTIMRCESYSLPASVRAHIDVVGPTTRFPALNTPLKRSLPKLERLFQSTRNTHRKTTAKSTTTADSPCQSGVTPDCIRAVYQVGNTTATSGKSSAAVNGFLEQYISQSDLNQFLKKYDPTRLGFIPQIIGPNDSKNPGVEASLDIQYISALTHDVENVTFWYTAGRAPGNPQNEPFLVWLMSLSNMTAPPLVISTSYGDDEPTVDYDYAQRVSTEFMKAGSRGITLLFSSGDSGAGGVTAADRECSAFVPTFPAGSPWVTAVGASQLVSYTSATFNETSAGFSSGGFANYFPSPDYQKEAVNLYLTKYGSDFPDQKLWNASGRAFPDVSALGVNFPIVVDGDEYAVDGTSCSSPTFAGLVTLLNDVLLAKGEAPLGFLNYLIYQYGEVAFNDVTTGSNPGCGTDGFWAAQYWDPVTGFGTPNWPEWLKIANAL